MSWEPMDPEEFCYEDPTKYDDIFRKMNCAPEVKPSNNFFVENEKPTEKIIEEIPVQELIKKTNKISIEQEIFNMLRVDGKQVG